jgi:hypothetical protein
MKLYSTITSERATKGQGGNHIEVTLSNVDRDILCRFEVLTKDERSKNDNRLRYFTKVIDGDIEFLKNLKSNISFYIDNEVIKGNNQKTS